MKGIITIRDVLGHPVLVVRGFGWRVFLRCLAAACRGDDRTFLSLIGV